MEKIPFPGVNFFVRLSDFEPAPDDFKAEFIAGLERHPKVLPCKVFYDEHGSRLFDQICQLDEYYLTRAEAEILRNNTTEIAALCGPSCVLVEPGSGNSSKTRLLLDHLERQVAYVPIDISQAHLFSAAQTLNGDYFPLEILPVCALSEVIFHNDSFVVHTLRGRSGKVDPKKRQRYSNEFRREAVEQMRGGNNIVRLARELGVCRRVLYNWRDQLDESNAPPTRTRELILRKQILRLKRLLANKTLEVDFFRHALQRVGARRRQNFHSGDKASTTR